MNLHEKHKADLNFVLRLKHIRTGLFVSDKGLVHRRLYAVNIGCGYAGLSKAEVLVTICEMLSNPEWIRDFNLDDFEIESDLA